MIWLCIVYCSIGHLYHLLRFVYWVYLSSWVLVRFLWVFHSLSHSCYTFGVLRVYVRVLWDPMLLLSRLICIRYERWITYERWVTFYSGLRINVLLIIPSLVIWLSFIVLIWVDHHSFHFLIALFYISSSLSRSSLHRLSIPYILTHISGSVPSTHHSHVSLIVWTVIIFLVLP